MANLGRPRNSGSIYRSTRGHTIEAEHPRPFYCSTTP
jgi:hypothetical protein